MLIVYRGPFFLQLSHSFPRGQRRHRRYRVVIVSSERPLCLGWIEAHITQLTQLLRHRLSHG